MSSRIGSLRIYNYRVWFVGILASNIGVWVNTTAQSWIVLTSLTNNDAQAVGIVIALQFGPTFVFAGIAGATADRFTRSKILLATHTMMAALSLALGVLMLTGAATLWVMYLFASLVGIVTAFDQPARHAIVWDLVPVAHASNAVALNLASFNIGRMVGPAIAGVAIAVIDAGWVFFANSITFAVMLIALMALRRSELVPRSKRTESSRIMDGFRYISRRPDLVMTLIIVFPVSVFAMNFALIASTMAVHFSYGPDGFGMLSSFLAIGAIVGSVVSAGRPTPRLFVIYMAASSFVVLIALTALMPTYWMFAVMLILVGYTISTVFATSNAYVQTSTELALRGRTIALYLAIVMLAGPVAAPGLGWVANVQGAPFGMLWISLMGFLFIAYCAAWQWWRKRHGSPIPPHDQRETRPQEQDDPE